MVHLGQQLLRKVTGSRATTAAIEAMTSEAGRSTLGGGLRAAVCTTVGITFEEKDASETFSGIEMPKNGSLFMCATSKS
nr:hypothetical protein [Tanacetum cinerariifolium]